MIVSGKRPVAYIGDIVHVSWAVPDTEGSGDGVKRLDGVVMTVLDDGRETDLDDILALAKSHGYREGVLWLMAESPLRGEVYSYGNHGAFWEKTGTVDGYA